MSPSAFNAATARAHLAAIRLRTAEPGIHDSNTHLGYDPVKIVDLGTKLLATQTLDTAERLAVHEHVLKAAYDAGYIPPSVRDLSQLCTTMNEMENVAGIHMDVDGRIAGVTRVVARRPERAGRCGVLGAGSKEPLAVHHSTVA